MSPTDERIRATYLIETAHPVEQAAEVMAGEQSTGTFTRLPGETDELRAAHAARVESVEVVESDVAPTLPHSRPPKSPEGARFQRARVVLSWPLSNMGPSLPNLMATIAGNLFELRQFSGLRLLDVDLPPAFSSAYQGPQFGIDGTRKISGVPHRPIIGTIIKPSVGLRPEQTAELVDQLATAGLDFIKDDELMANGPHSPFADRVRAAMQVIDAHAQRTGKKVMFAFNITGDMDEMLRNHDIVLEAGGTCVMLSLNSVGLPAAVKVRQHSQLPIHGHRNGWGMFTRCPGLGIDFVAYQKLWRVAGVDHLHCNGLRNKFWEPDDSVVRSARACVTPLFADKPWQAMPVLSSAQWAGQAPDSYQRLQSTDLMYVCGGGIFAHPGGASAGVASIRQGWEAAVQGKSLQDYARDHKELQQALDFYGRDS